MAVGFYVSLLFWFLTSSFDSVCVDIINILFQKINPGEPCGDLDEESKWCKYGY